MTCREDHPESAQFAQGFLSSLQYDLDVGEVCQYCQQVIEDSSVRMSFGSHSTVSHRSCYETGLREQQDRAVAFQRASGRDSYNPEPLYQ